MIRNSFEGEARRVETALSSKVQTAVGTKIETERLAESLVNRQIQILQTFGTTLPRGEPSPDIRTGVIGQTARRPVPFGVPEIRMKYPIRLIARTTRKSLEKKQQLKEGKPNIVDRFFVWVNAFFK